VTTQKKIQIERTYPAAPEKIWELWTTAAGIESWWAPEGFAVRVDALEVWPGGTTIFAAMYLFRSKLRIDGCES